MRYILACLLLFTSTVILSQLREEPYLKFAKTYRDTLSPSGSEGVSVVCSRNGGLITSYNWGENRQQAIPLGNSGLYIDTARWGSTVIIRTDSNGNELWVKAIKPGVGHRVREDKDGNLILAGTFFNLSRPIDFDPGPDEYLVYAIGVSFTEERLTSYILKLDPEGNFLWVKPLRSTKTITINDVQVDNSGAIYVTGKFHDTCNLSTDPDVPYRLKSRGYYDQYIAKYSSNGDLLWAQQISLNSGGLMSGGTLCVDDSSNVYAGLNPYSTQNVYYVGDNSSHALQNAYPVVLVKLDSAGNYIWKKMFTGTDCIGISIINVQYHLNNIYIGGSYQGTVDFTPGTGSPYEMFNDRSQNNGYIGKYDLDGNLHWVKGFTSVNEGSNHCSGIVLDKEDNVYVTGRVRYNVFLNPDILAGDITQVHRESIYHVKLNSEGGYVWGAALGSTYYDFSEAYEQAIDSNGNLYAIGAYYGQGAIDVDPSAGTYILDTCSRSNPLLYKWGQHMVNSVKESTGTNPGISLYPNPAGNYLYLDNRNTLQAAIRSMDGRLQWQAAIAPNAAIAVQQLPPGMYLLELTSADGSRERIKWLKE